MQLALGLSCDGDELGASCLTCGSYRTGNEMTEEIDITQYIEPSRNLDHWRIEIPNLYDDAKLDAYEFRLLVHYARVGNCYEGTRKTAEITKMSVGAVVKKRKSLQSKGFIVIDDSVSSFDTLIISVVDKWEENFSKYNKCSPDERKNRLSIKDFIRSPDEQLHQPLSKFIEYFGKLQSEDQAQQIFYIYTKHGKDRYFEILEWSKDKKYKHISSRIKAMTTAADKWDDNMFKKDTPENYDDELKDGGYERL